MIYIYFYKTTVGEITTHVGGTIICETVVCEMTLLVKISVGEMIVDKTNFGEVNQTQ